jgi:ATP-dependent DNA helicase RecQ
MSGFGQAKAKQYGHAFLNVILEYCQEHHLSSSIHTKQQKKERKEKITTTGKEDTKSITYKLYKEGNSITDIATLRNLAASTIEAHLSYYISRGIISVNELVKTEKLILIEPHLENFEGGSLTSIKEILGDAVSFGEIRMTLASKEWKKIQES